MSLGTFRKRPIRRRWLLGATMTAAIAFAVFMVAGAGAVLPNGSTFESADGNLIVDNVSTSSCYDSCTDWATAPNRTEQSDLVKSTSDDAFGGGSKEDDPTVKLVEGSIPPNKSDLSEFYTSHETVSGHTFLYLAWERSNTLGNANMDFEVNQTDLTTSWPTSPGSYTIPRQAGDLKFTYDFGGSGTPSLGMLIWLTDASTPAPSGGYTTNTCYSAHSFPCWGNHVDLTAAGLAEGAINAVQKHDPILDTDLPSETFGEMGVDLTLALPDVFGPNPSTCESLGSAFLTTRSASSFTSEIKDVIAPVKVSVSNCGYVLVHKTAGDTSSDQAGATFTIEPGKTTSSGTNDSDTIPGVSGHDGYYCIDNLLLGQTYTVTEDAAPSGYDVDPNSPWTGVSPVAGTCSGVSYSPSAPTAQVDASDPPQVGAIVITKNGKDKNCTGEGTSSSGADTTCSAASTRLLSGAVFELKDSSDVVQYTSAATGSDGTVCIDNVAPGDYTLHEKTAPTNYFAAADSSVTITADTTCTGSPATKTVTDEPKTTITVSTTPVISGSTTSTVKCVNSSTTGGTDATGVTSPVATPKTTNELAPGTYTCTVVIDP